MGNRPAQLGSIIWVPNSFEADNITLKGLQYTHIQIMYLRQHQKS